MAHREGEDLLHRHKIHELNGLFVVAIPELVNRNDFVLEEVVYLICALWRNENTVRLALHKITEGRLMEKDGTTTEGLRP